MLNNFIGGGQIFLHRFRMFKQVAISTFKFSCLFALFITILVKIQQYKNIDISAVISYISANTAIAVNETMPTYNTRKGDVTIDSYNKHGLVKKNDAAFRVISSPYFSKEYNKALVLFNQSFIIFLTVFFSSNICMFMFWTKFGKFTQADQKIQGEELLEPEQVKNILLSLGKASNLTIGEMPIVKESETKHFLVTGSTGCGKTNLFYNVFNKIVSNKQPAIILDQTGEMIEKYYNPERGDIIFNPFDTRSKMWDLQADCSDRPEIERLANILFSFNRKKHSHSADPFWEKSAEIVFISCIEYLKETEKFSIESLNYLLKKTSVKDLVKKLRHYEAIRYLDTNNSTSSSILSVLATNTKPLNYLQDDSNVEKFSLKGYFKDLECGATKWLFFGTKPSNRDLTLPLISCLMDLSLLQLMELGPNSNRRIWFAMDELSALGKLPTLSTLMTEGRKYGACIMAGLQSLSQIYANYGQYEASTIFNQFGTLFFFKNHEPLMAKFIQEICGGKTVIKQQKNTSFGASSYRDGQSYTEQEKFKNLLEYSDLNKLSVGECYVLLPEAKTRLTKLKLPLATT